MSYLFPTVGDEEVFYIATSHYFTCDESAEASNRDRCSPSPDCDTFYITTTTRYPWVTVPQILDPQLVPMS
jgi:hypothetical protein